MKVGFIGAGHIGGNLARLAAKAGHEVLVSNSRKRSLDKLAIKQRVLAPEMRRFLAILSSSPFPFSAISKCLSKN
jgi:predicted dinucleotide-binding enzyme